MNTHNDLETRDRDAFLRALDAAERQLDRVNDAWAQWCQDVCQRRETALGHPLGVDVDRWDDEYNAALDLGPTDWIGTARQWITTTRDALNQPRDTTPRDTTPNRED